MKYFLAVLGFSVVIVGGVYIAHAQGTPPSIPKNINASLLPTHQVYVSWSPSIGSSTIDGYYLYRNGAFIASIPGYTYYTDAPGGGVFQYTVSSYDVNGNFSQQSSPTPAITVVGDTIPPTAPTDLTGTATASTITLTWNPSTDNVGVVGYYISRNGVRIQTTNAITGSSYTDTGLTAGVTYTYSVTAYDASRNISNATAIQVETIYDVSPPSVPTGVTATAVSPSQIDLTWQPSTDNIQVSGYLVYRNGKQVGKVSTSTYDDGGLSPQTNYTYQVAAYDEVNNTSNLSSPEVSAMTFNLDTIPPTTPNNLTVTAVSPTQAILSWTPSTDNVAVGGYYVYRGTLQIATVTATTTYTDSGLSTSTYYLYSVRAYDTSYNLSGPVYQTVTTPSAPIATPTAPTPSSSPSSSPVVTQPTQPVSPANPITPSLPVFIVNLSYGISSPDVTALQNFLISKAYLGVGYNTGFYGSLTQAAVKKFQCAENIVCSGTPLTTGWGSVGPHTRATLNSF